MKKVLQGYFYTYRGNGYGPFSTKKLAKESAIKKKTIEYPSVFYWFGDIEIVDKKLIAENLVMVDHDFPITISEG